MAINSAAEARQAAFKGPFLGVTIAVFALAIAIMVLTVTEVLPDGSGFLAGLVITGWMIVVIVRMQMKRRR